MLAQLQVEFTPLKTKVDESLIPGESAAEYVSRLALVKARAGLALTQGQAQVLGSDTSVVINDRILGKPRDKDDFVTMMKGLSGKTHQVLTAVAVVSSCRDVNTLVTTDVTFKVLSTEEIDWYWSTQEPIDKAGGYGIQGLSGQFVTHISGSYSAVVGLPLYQTAELLKQIIQE